MIIVIIVIISIDTVVIIFIVIVTVIIIIILITTIIIIIISGVGIDHILDLHIGEWIDQVDAHFLHEHSSKHKYVSLHLQDISNITPEQISAITSIISPKLISIEIIDCNDLSWNTIKIILEKASFTESLIFLKNSWVCDSVVEFIANKFTKTFRKLVIENCTKLTDQALYQMGRKCYNVKSVSLLCCPNITDLGLGEKFCVKLFPTSIFLFPL